MPQDSGAVRERDLVLPADEQGISDANVIYRHVTAGGLNELDKIARFILAVASWVVPAVSRPSAPALFTFEDAPKTLIWVSRSMKPNDRF